VNRHEFLRTLHAVAQPRGYLEIGVNDGRSLALSAVPSIAIDPAFKVTAEISCDVRLVKATSDDFFAQPSPVAHLPESVIDLAFIDGMHLFEFALRDFINVERHSTPGSVIVFDDMLPRDVDEAARDRHTKFWTGDVYKMIPVLRHYRPDLLCVPCDTQPTGLLVVFGADRTNTTLQDNYDEIVAEWVTPDPQDVPSEVLQRTGAIPPKRLLGAPIWTQVTAARSAAPGAPTATIQQQIARALGVDAPAGRKSTGVVGRLRQRIGGRRS
jgi:hypothetical protein